MFKGQHRCLQSLNSEEKVCNFTSYWFLWLIKLSGVNFTTSYFLIGTDQDTYCNWQFLVERIKLEAYSNLENLKLIETPTQDIVTELTGTEVASSSAPYQGLQLPPYPGTVFIHVP